MEHQLEYAKDGLGLLYFLRLKNYEVECKGCHKQSKNLMSYVESVLSTFFKIRVILGNKEIFVDDCSVKNHEQHIKAEGYKLELDVLYLKMLPLAINYSLNTLQVEEIRITLLISQIVNELLSLDTFKQPA